MPWRIQYYEINGNSNESLNLKLISDWSGQTVISSGIFLALNSNLFSY